MIIHEYVLLSEVQITVSERGGERISPQATVTMTLPENASGTLARVLSER